MRISWARRPPVRRLMAAMLIVSVGAGLVLGLTRLQTDTGPESFLPAGDEVLAGLEDSASSFGGDPVVVIAESAEPGQLLSPTQLPRLLALEGRLARLDDASVVYGPATVLNQIAASAQNTLAELTGRRDALRARVEQANTEQSREHAEAALREFDRRYGSLLVRGLPAGLPTLHNPTFVDQVIFKPSGAPKPQWDFVVPKQNAITILVRPREHLDQAGAERLVEQVRNTVSNAGLSTTKVTVTGVPAVTAALGEQVRQEIPLVGGLAVVAIGASFLLMPWMRRRRYRLWPLAVTLTATAMVLSAFGWLSRPLSLGVIAFLPILVGIASDFPAYLTRSRDRRRVVVVAVASAAAFASLAMSPLPFVRDLGLALAAGQLLSLGLAFIVRKSRFGNQIADREAGATDEATLSDDGESAIGERRVAEQARPGLTLRTRIGALAFVGLVAVAGWSALGQLEVEARPDKLAEGLPAMNDVHHAEHTLGASGEVQVLVRANDVLAPKVLAWMRDAEQNLIVTHGDELKPVISPSSLLGFLGPDPTRQQVVAATSMLPEYLTQAVIRSDHRRAVMTYQLGLQDLTDQTRLIDKVRAGLPTPPKGVEADVVGLPVAAARGYELVSGERYLHNSIGVVGAGLILLLGLARRSDGARAILAAGLATGWSLAAMWLLDVPLTPLTIALGSLTMAISCEYTVMLRESAGQGLKSLHRTVAVAALSAALGYLALAVSGLSILREFGLLLAGTVVLSFAAAHVVARLLPGKQASASAGTSVLPASSVPTKETKV